jgi:CYTH domain-containing protein
MLRANGRIGVVFTDIELPGRMTGFDLARWIGREHTDVRALLTSGHVAPPNCKAGNWSPSRMHSTK